MTNTNVAFYAGGQDFETWKDWSYPTATYWLPASSSDYSSHPTLNEPLQRGAAYFNTLTLEVRVYTGTDWVPNLDQDKTIDGAWTFTSMPKVNNGSGPYDILPPGGVAGQVLSKVDANSYNTQWTDPPAGTFDPSFNYTITGFWDFQEIQTFSAVVNFEGNIYADNGQIYYWRKADNSLTPQLRLDSGDVFRVGRSDITNAFAGLENTFFHAGVEAFKTDTQENGSLLVYDRLGTEKKAGFRNPSNEVITADGYTFMQDDEGRVRYNTANHTSYNVPQLEAFTSIRYINRGNTDVRLTESGTDIRALLGGSEINGNLRIAPNSVVDIYYQSPSTVIVSGNGISAF